MKAAPTWMTARGAWMFYACAAPLALLGLVFLARSVWDGVAWLMIASYIALHPYFRRSWFKIGYDIGYDEAMDDALKINHEDRP